MPDREKVINALGRCELYGYCRDVNCPYYENMHCLELLRKDALALLKEREPVPSGKRIKAGDVVLCFYECGHCKNAISKPWRYCPFCGRTVKWDD